MALGGGQADSVPLPPLPGHPPSAVSQRIWSAGEGSHPGRGGLHLSDHPESCSSRDGAGVLSLVPRSPLGRALSFCFSSCFSVAAE